MFSLMIPSHPEGFGLNPHHARRATYGNGYGQPHIYGAGHRRPQQQYDLYAEPEFDFNFGAPGLSRHRSSPAGSFNARPAAFKPYEAYGRAPQSQPQPQPRPQSLHRSLSIAELQAIIVARQQEEQEQEQASRQQREREAEAHLHRRNALRRKSEDERLAELEEERARLLARRAEREQVERERAVAAHAAAQAAAYAAAYGQRERMVERERQIAKMRAVKERHEIERRRQAHAAAVAQAQAHAQAHAQAQAQRANDPAHNNDSDIEDQRREAHRLVVETFLGELLGTFLDAAGDTSSETNNTAVHPEQSKTDVKGKGKAREVETPAPQQATRESAAPQKRTVHFYVPAQSAAGPSYSTPEVKVPAPVVASVAAPTATAAPAPVAAPAATTATPSEPARPESPSRDLALAHVHAILAKFTALVSAFAFPRLLSFTPSAPTAQLSYGPQNAPVHTYEHALNDLLQELDGIDSAGDGAVRRERRELVRRVERELGWLEAEVGRAWEREQAVQEPEPESESELEPKEDVKPEEKADAAPTETAEAETEPIESAPQETAAALTEPVAASKTVTATEQQPTTDALAANADANTLIAEEAEESTAVNAELSVGQPAEVAATALQATVSTEPAESEALVAPTEDPAVVTNEQQAVEKTTLTDAEPSAPESVIAPAESVSPAWSPLLSGAFVPVPTSADVSHEEQSEDEEQVIAQSTETEEDTSGLEDEVANQGSEEEYELL